MFKGFSKLFFFFVLLIFIGNPIRAQKDSVIYERYGEKFVWFSDFGFSTAPIKLKYPFENGIERIKFKNNMSAIWGLGFSYKWFALRLSITIPGTIRPPSQFGRTTYYDIGFDFTVKRSFFDVDFHDYNGYAIKNAYRWNDSLNELKPHDIRSDIGAASFSINTWFFKNHHFKMQAFRGKTGAYKKDIHTFYLKGTFNVYGVGSNKNHSLIPIELQDSLQSKTRTVGITAVDIGIVPGMAYVKRWKSFQIGVMGGAGLVVQSKFYSLDSLSRGYLGLAPRFDIKIIAGYNQPRYFLMLVTDFDNKSIRFSNLVYRQTFYNIKLVGGIRLDRKKRDKPDKKH